MRIHVIQTGTVAIKQVQREGRETGNPILNIVLDKNWTEPLPIFAYVIEHPEGLIVVDTGETARVAERGYFPWWHPYYRYGLQEWVQPEEEIGPQMRASGARPPRCPLGIANPPPYGSRRRAGPFSKSRASGLAQRVHLCKGYPRAITRLSFQSLAALVRPNPGRHAA